ncbi:hypothetical protein KGQ31_02305 [Patescibacteria group bacterium]|nr:hypothetical protein [Patescibacteria group bacterium]
MSERRGILVFALVVVAVALGVVAFSKLTGSTQKAIDPIAARKQEVLALIGGGAPLTPEHRNILYRDLSGKQAEEYNFTSSEKAAIIESLNKQ